MFKISLVIAYWRGKAIAVPTTCFIHCFKKKKKKEAAIERTDEVLEDIPQGLCSGTLNAAWTTAGLQRAESWKLGWVAGAVMGDYSVHKEKQLSG